IGAPGARPSRHKKQQRSRNTCVGNVSSLIQSRDACRIRVHLPNDRARFALHATENIFRMSATHECHLASLLACGGESRYIKKKKAKGGDALEQPERSCRPWPPTSSPPPASSATTTHPPPRPRDRASRPRCATSSLSSSARRFTAPGARATARARV